MKLNLPAALFLLGYCFSACQKIKTDTCKPESQITRFTITTNSPVVEGWPIYLSTTATMGSLFHWSGPNGWDINYQYYSSSANEQQRLNATFADSGEYKLELRNTEGCIDSRGFATVKVIPAPLPPCTVANNSSTSNVVGVGGNTYTYINFSPSTYYVVQASGGGETLYFYFQGSVPPKPGVYKTSGYAPTTETQVGCWISNYPYDFINQPGQDVYVNKVNGKTQVSFCNCVLSNPLGSTVIKVSARITQP